MKIHRGLLDPDQQFIDAEVDKLTGNDVEMYEKFHTIEGVGELWEETPSRALAEKYAFIWTRELEQRVKVKAWQAQHAHQEKVWLRRGLATAKGAVAAMRIVNDLHRQGRKTVKIEDLMDAYRKGEADD